MPEWNNLSKGTIGVGKNDSKIEQNFRETELSWMNVSKDTLDIWSKFSDVAREINRRFFNFDLNGFYEPAQLTLYKSENKGHYDWHTDSLAPGDTYVPRKLSMVLLLNDPEDFIMF